MTQRLLLVVVLLSLAAPAAFAGQAGTPPPTKNQREALKSIVAAVDQAADAGETPAVTWPVHLMRASDGSHYVAFTAQAPPASPFPARPVILYVRLASAVVPGAQARRERSRLAEWLASSSNSLPPLARQGIAMGDMPVMGTTGSLERRPPTSPEMASLQAMDIERRRALERQKEHDKQRRDELDGRTTPTTDFVPFEDFDVAAATVGADGTPAISRALTAGPGDYELFVAWADAAAKPPAAVHVHVMKRMLHLPPAWTKDLMLSSVIIADRVGVRDVPYSAEEQRAHPYTIGPTEITPARDSVFARDERISVAFQVINAHASETGKPDVSINFRIVRVANDRETQVASLTPQRYHDLTLPAEFDLRLGHPIFAAVSAPLATIPRGSYRLKVLATDHISGTTASADADFTVVGTPSTLLAEAPSLGQPFKHESVLTTDVLSVTIQGLRLPTASRELTRALDLAQKAQFVELLREEPVAAPEQGTRTALTALALYSVGDAASASVQLQRALQLGAPAGAVQFLLGAARALQGRDVDAIAAWQAAIDGGMPARAVLPFLIDAHLRRGDAAKASALLPADAPDGTRAAVLIASGHEAEAIPLLKARLLAQEDDQDAQWLLLHALFATIVKAPAGTVSPNVGAFIAAARAYVAANGAHAALARDWLSVLAQ